MEPAKQQDFESSEGSDSEPGSEYELEDISEQNLADGEIRPYQFEPEFSEKNGCLIIVFGHTRSAKNSCPYSRQKRKKIMYRFRLGIPLFSQENVTKSHIST